ncbi:hypothetical protein AD006_17635 [Pseudonocardia sp. EC080610-09]|uniref:enoyl-CoA hydratase/isomerase family protein n=1 Tax=unclassified Pseudonocardia TaxID=2619320 RepID=UPI000706B27C|nr:MULTISPECIES: enoyl-CoA hydratase/isomerase family protein [unclassified Pseudonocardia]ALL76674.1 hypothetical protein AD006_17635 [Pseudonocardia sp. EC080610-09]ALL83702.1 hypothetical protein AD017_25470 [Pseudonocardia sp. EC080619-01]
MPLVTLDVDDGIAVVRLARPEHLNALSDELLDDLESTLDTIDSRADVRAVVVAGSGRAFCAGADLRRLRARLDGAQDAILAFVRRAGELFARVEASPRPVVAAVHGYAVAGGFELVLAADMVVAAEGTLLGDGHLRFGMTPGGGGAVRLQRKVPANVATRLLLTGDLEPAERFVGWGLVEEVVPADDLLPAALRLARRVLTRNDRGVAEIKRVARAARDLPTDEALELEFDAFAGYVGSDELRAGLTRFAERSG